MVSPYISISQLQAGEEYTQICLVGSTKRMTAKNNKPYLMVTILDITGSIEGRIWNYAKSNNSITEGKFVLLKFKVESFNDKLMFSAQAEDAISYNEQITNLSDYILSPNENIIKVYTSEIETIISDLADPHYRDIVRNACSPQRINLLEALKSFPYGYKGPLAYKGGLLVHVHQLLQTSLASLESFKNLDLPLNRSLIVAGSLFRDLNWIVCASFRANQWLPTDSAELIGGRSIAATLINHICITAESDLRITIPKEKKLALQSIALESDSLLESKIVTSSFNLVDNMFLAEHELKRVHIGEDSWSQNLFIGHHANVRA